MKGRKLQEKVERLLDQVGLNPEWGERYPHQFSGGQRQRLNIARAISTKPRFIVADEAVSALDVSVQAQIINLLKHLQRELGLTYLFISHDLGVVRYISDRIGVMKAGELIEIGDRNHIFHTPQHDYTKKLIGAIPQSM
ncbi:ABC transporter ATP-binding protein [Geomicrobium sp. JCM 19039]|uniref:ATP-binding cassette domain-containing protein n=1 Tax=Geomicrobium sp. JCM 19039 TaxID=1460636 RepID=UPI00045F3DA5|nr:ABC transporter ATP-binding protein [Geomicrobium sp. JCM 19039]GAK13055.1 oligopeptide transport ATP-binding protein OppF [Geomicrobium sp. JCM 19039]